MTSPEFAEWVAYLADDPDIGTRADGLAAAIAAHVGRIEATLGGRPVQVCGRLIEWGGRATADDENEIAKALEKWQTSH